MDFNDFMRNVAEAKKKALDIQNEEQKVPEQHLRNGDEYEDGISETYYQESE